MLLNKGITIETQDGIMGRLAVATKTLDTLYEVVFREKPLLVWDGDCGFCKYWMLRWKMLTGDSVRYEPYQKVADDIPGIPIEAFQKAIRLIETDGKVYDGPHAAYQALEYSDNWSGYSKIYEKRSFFRIASDYGYDFVAKNRPTLFFFTKLLWGKNPSRPKKYWMFYLLGLLVTITILVVIFS